MVKSEIMNNLEKAVDDYLSKEPKFLIPISYEISLKNNQKVCLTFKC